MRKRQTVLTGARQGPLQVGVLIVVLGALLGAGCGASTMALYMYGDEKQLNACGRPEPHSVVVRVYQLRGEANFRRATSESFWQNDRAAIGEDLVDKLELTLQPGENRKISLTLNETTRYVALAADFCKAEGDLWRKIHNLEDGKGDLWIVLFGGRIAFEQR